MQNNNCCSATDTTVHVLHRCTPLSVIVSYIWYLAIAAGVSYPRSSLQVRRVSTSISACHDGPISLKVQNVAQRQTTEKDTCALSEVCRCTSWYTNSGHCKSSSVWPWVGINNERRFEATISSPTAVAAPRWVHLFLS